MLRRGSFLLIALCACGRVGFGTGDDSGGDDVSGDGGGSGTGDGGGSGDPDGGGGEGGTWTAMTPALPSTTDLYAVWAYAPNDIWVGGVGGVSYQFDGASWTARPGPMRDINWLWGASPTDLWEVGTLCEVRRWNGSAWNQVNVPGCTNESYFAMAGVSATDVWLAGVGGRIDHLVGTTWTLLPQSNNIDLWSVWPISASELYFTGTRGTILHWTGTMADENIGLNVIVTSVWASSGNDVWAVGGAGMIWHKVNGGAWAPVTSPTSTFLYSVWGTSATDVWAMGDFATLLHYDGVQWSVVTAPVPNGTELRAMARVPGGGSVLVGSNGTILVRP